MIAEHAIVFPSDHPALPGHFPGDPMVPGVVLLDAAADLARGAGCRRVTGVRAAKFRTALRPGTSCLIQLSSREDGALDVECSAGGSTILTAILDCETGAREP